MAHCVISAVLDSDDMTVHPCDTPLHTDTDMADCWCGPETFPGGER